MERLWGVSGKPNGFHECMVAQFVASPVHVPGPNCWRSSSTRQVAQQPARKGATCASLCPPLATSPPLSSPQPARGATTWATKDARQALELAHCVCHVFSRFHFGWATGKLWLGGNQKNVIVSSCLSGPARQHLSPPTAHSG